GAAQQNAFRNVSLLGDTTFGGGNRWDVRGAGSTGANLANLSTGGQAYNLIKTGTNQVNLVNVTVDPALGDIDVRSGILGYEANSFINANGGAVTLTGTLSGTNALNRVGGSGNTLTFNGDASAFSGAVNANAGTVQVLNSTNPLGNTSLITLSNVTTTFGGTG